MLQIRSQMSRSGPAARSPTTEHHRLLYLAIEEAGAYPSSDCTTPRRNDGRASQCVGGNILQKTPVTDNMTEHWCLLGRRSSNISGFFVGPMVR